jgi:bifunctional oligoribonuclease and PAP phosphatase NrnA
MNKEIAEILKNEDRFLVLTHVNPDGDAVGSMLGLRNALKEQGKQVWAIAEKALPATYAFLPGCDTVLINPDQFPSDINWIVAVDAAESSRMAGNISAYRGVKLINIDHHPTNPLFGDLNCVEPSAMSTAELVHQLLQESGYKVSRDVGLCLYTGLFTDTGGFRFAGVNSRTLRMGAELLEPGIDSYEVTRPLYEEMPFARLRLECLMLERIEVLLDGRLLISVLFEEDFASVGATMADSENMVNRLRESRGVTAGVLIIKMSDLTRVSFRSKELDVAQVAKTLGGGGHAHAAGLKTNIPLEELKSKITSLISKLL